MGQEHLDPVAHDLFDRKAEHLADLVVGETDGAGRIDDDHRIRQGIEDFTDELGSQHGAKCGQRTGRRIALPRARRKAGSDATHSRTPNSGRTSSS